MDILIFALVTFFLIWKFRSALSKEQPFIKSNKPDIRIVTAKDVTAEISQKLMNSKKNQKNLLESVYEVEKLKLPENLHITYKEIFFANPNLTVSFIKESATHIYEEVYNVFRTKQVFFSGFSVESSFFKNFSERVMLGKYSAYLVKILSVDIQNIVVVGKAINFAISISSNQLIYKENEEGIVIEGSKVAEVNVSEVLHISYSPSNNGDVWFLDNLTQGN